jgi:hypothetical protein
MGRVAPYLFSILAVGAIGCGPKTETFRGTLRILASCGDAGCGYATDPQDSRGVAAFSLSSGSGTLDAQLSWTVVSQGVGDPEMLLTLYEECFNLACAPAAVSAKSQSGPVTLSSQVSKGKYYLIVDHAVAQAAVVEFTLTVMHP